MTVNVSLKGECEIPTHARRESDIAAQPGAIRIIDGGNLHDALDDELLRQKVEEGHYSGEDEVIADALRLMQARDAAVQIRRARLQDAIDRGYDDVAAGRVTVLEDEDQIDAFFAAL